jgi:hypothetical protein
MKARVASSSDSSMAIDDPLDRWRRGLWTGTCTGGEKGEDSCARPAGKKRRAPSPAARRCSSAVVGVASVSLGTGAQGGLMPRADGSELRLRVMTADTVGSSGGKQRRGDRTAQLGVGWSSGGSQRPTRSFGQDGSSDQCCRSRPIMPTRVTDSAAPGSQSAHGAWRLSY